MNSEGGRLALSASYVVKVPLAGAVKPVLVGFGTKGDNLLVCTNI